MSERIRQVHNKTDKLEDLSAFYNYSSRRLRDQIIKGKVLGVKHEPGLGIIYYDSGDYVMRGPISDVPQRYILPSGTTLISHEVCSGEVTGVVYQGELEDKVHPEVEVMAEPGCSGIVVEFSGLQTIP